MKTLNAYFSDLLLPPLMQFRDAMASFLGICAYLIGGTLLIVVTASIWWLAYLLGLAAPPSLGAVVAPFLPVLMDLGRFTQYNLSHNLLFVLMAVGLFVGFEFTLRRKVAAGNSPAGSLGLFKAASLLLGLFTMAISLYGILMESTMQGQDPRPLIGALYYKFGIWVLTAVLMIVRYLWFDFQQTANAHE